MAMVERLQQEHAEQQQLERATCWAEEEAERLKQETEEVERTWRELEEVDVQRLGEIKQQLEEEKRAEDQCAAGLHGAKKGDISSAIPT